MKRITRIRLKDYRAFYGEHIIDIPHGQNVILYGENGSGKSSLYHALLDFFETSAPDYDLVRQPLPENLFRRIERQQEAIEPPADPLLEVTFTDTDATDEADKPYTVSNHAPRHREGFIQTARLLRAFLSYKELIPLYVPQKNISASTGEINHWDLIMALCQHHRNSVTQRTFGEEWAKIVTLNGMDKGSREYNAMKPAEYLRQFNEGLTQYLKELKTYGQLDLLLSDYFQHRVEIDFEFRGVNYQVSERNKWNRLRGMEIYFDIRYKGIRLREHQQLYHAFLNEARLSALAITIYLASIKTNPSATEYEILFLDDVFIGLDTGNRRPLLRILREHFSDYQIFLATYDRHWFHVAKDWLISESNPQRLGVPPFCGWYALELYAGRDPKQTDKPVLYTSLCYLDKAEFHLHETHEYPVAANYLRKALEQRLKELVPLNKQFSEHLDKESGIKVLRKAKTLGEMIDCFGHFCDEHKISVLEVRELKQMKDWYMNPFSHDNLDSPIYRDELEEGLTLLRRLEALSFEVILEAGGELSFRFDKADGSKSWIFPIKLKEKLRLIRQVEDIETLTNPALCAITEWIENGTKQDVDWPDNKLLTFYRACYRKFFDSEPPEDTDWLAVFRLVDGRALREKEEKARE